MLTLFLIIAFANFKIISSLDNNDNQFIDSLPEKEKQEFLQKVEKRIEMEVPEVKSPEKNDTNVELYEKRLEDQGKSIQNILRSEIDSLKAHNRRNINDTERREDPHIDLTMRSQIKNLEAMRRKNKDIVIPNGDQFIPVEVQYDRNVSIKPHNQNAKIDKNESKGIEISRDNISLPTKSENVKSAIKRKRMGRRSSDIKTEFDTERKQKNEPDSGLGTNNTKTVNSTSNDVDITDSTDQPLGISTKLDMLNPTNEKEHHLVDIAKSTEYPLGISTKLDILNATSIQDDHDIISTTQGKNNDTIKEVSDFRATKLTENSSNSTFNSMDANSSVEVDTIAVYNESLETSDEFDNKTQYNDETNTHDPSLIVENIDTAIDDKDNSTTTNIAIPNRNSTALVNPSLNTTVKKIAVITDKKVGSNNDDDKIHKDYPTSTADPNKSKSDSQSEEITEEQPHYVPVYNYDPENAYYNPNVQTPNGNDDGEEIVLPKNVKETHSTITNFDVYTNENRQSLRVKDVKERITSNDKIRQSFDIYDMISKELSEESSGDDVIFEKPLKHILKKIRTRLYKSKINKKSNNDIKSKLKSPENKKERDDDTIDKKTVAEIFTNFGVMLQNLVDKASNTDVPTIHKHIADSLEIYNKKLKNTGFTKIFDEIQKIKNNIEINKLIESKNNVGNKEYQSRFHIKNRNEKYNNKQNKAHPSFEHTDISDIQKVEKHHKTYEKSATKINDDYLELHVNVLKRLVNENDWALKKYDWLGTTVLIRGGLEILQVLTDKKLQRKKLHYLDQKLLEFTMELFEKAKAINEEQRSLIHIGSRRSQKRKPQVSFQIPKSKKGKKFNTLNRMYSELTKARSVSRTRHSVQDFKEFLYCLSRCLNNFHTAIKQISLVTTYKKQRWYKNIKQLYLKSAGDKEYLELFLHLVMARLIDMIDGKAKEMEAELEESHENFIKNQADMEIIQVEVVQVLRICNKLSELSD